MVRREDGVFGTPDGQRIFHRRWLPEGDARAAVVIVHGYAEHSGRYDYTGERLAREGFAAYALDLRGHGQSSGARAYVRSMNDYLEEVRTFLGLVRGRDPGKPLFLLGHSMGGAIVTLFLVTDRPDVGGALLSGPVLSVGAGGLRERLLRALGRVVPRLPLVKLAAADVSRDADIVAKYDADPLVSRGRLRAGLIAAMLRASRRSDDGASSIAMPLLIMHGTEDQLASPDGSRRLYDRVGSADRTLKLYDGLYHEILNEPERDTVLDDIVAWLSARL